MKIKNYILFLIVLSICPFWAGSQQYNIIRQGVCWTTPTAVDSSLTRLVYVSVSGAGPISVNYVNAGGVSVDVSGGGSFEMGYCGCCAPPVDSSAIDILYYTDGDSILNGDTILYKNYYNHVFLSGNGDNFTGRMGNFNRPFASPWAAQDSLSAETNLSFLAYQGNYTYSGPYSASNIQALTRTDTFRLYGFPGSTFEMLGATGNIRPFVTDVTGASSTTPRYIYIDTPESIWNFTDNQSLSFPIGVYNDESEITFRARKFTQAGGRMLNSIGAARYARIEIDSLYTSGGVALGVFHDFTTSGTDTITRDVSINLGEVYCGGATDVISALRVQVGESGRGLVDTLSKISIKAYRLRTPLTGGAMIWFSDSSSLINSSVDISIGEYYSSAAKQYFLSAKTGRSGQRQSQVKNSKINVSGGRVETSGKLIQLGWSDVSPDTLEVNGNSFFEINIGSAQISGTNAIYISKLILKDSAIVRINCEDCNFSQSPAIVIRRCDIPDGTKLIFSGSFSSNAPGELISIEGNNTDLSGLSFEGATFINNGASEWIQAASPTAISGVSGLWSNSDSVINVTIQSNEFWGFAGCDGAYTHLQEVLDGVCDSIAAVPEDLNVAEDDLVANGSHTTDWLDHTIEFDFTGAPLDTIVYRWPSPDGEVQGLYIADGDQEMSLLMNNWLGTDFTSIAGYNLANEITFGNPSDTVTIQADKWRADVQNMVRGDTIRSVLAIDSDTEIKLKYVPISGRVSDTTDGSGDIVIPLGVTMGSVNFTALVGARGTTFQQAQVISNTATNITVRVLDDSGAPITGTAVVVDWMVMDY